MVFTMPTTKHQLQPVNILDALVLFFSRWTIRFVRLIYGNKTVYLGKKLSDRDDEIL